MAEIEDGGHIGVVHQGGQSRFVDERFQECRVAGHVREQQLDHHPLGEPFWTFRGGKIDLSHTARAEQTLEREAANLGSGSTRRHRSHDTRSQHLRSRFLQLPRATYSIASAIDWGIQDKLLEFRPRNVHGHRIGHRQGAR